MVRTERLGSYRKRALQQLLSLRKFLFLNQHIGEAVLGRGDNVMFRRQIFQPETERLAQIRLGQVVLVLLGIGLAAILQQQRNVQVGRSERPGPKRDDFVDHRNHLVVGLIGLLALAFLRLRVRFGAVEHREIVDAVAAHDVAFLARRQLVVERERTLEQLLRVGKQVLVEIDAAEIVQRLRQREIRTRPAAFEHGDHGLQGVFRVREPPDVAIEIAELRHQDCRHLVVPPRPGDGDGLFGERNRLGLLAGLVEPDDLLVLFRQVALGVSVLHRDHQGGNGEGHNQKDEAESIGVTGGAHGNLDRNGI